ncbi:MAG: hypothetical protein VX672_05290, partial [Planctomycetota bacterium]|nr:hypothetical protein [Planctomycetota bacterium]
MPRARLAISFRCALLAAAVCILQAAPGSWGQTTGWTPFSDLPGAEAMREVSRSARRIGRGGAVRDVRFDETHVYWLSGTGWRRVSLDSGEIEEADATALPARAGGGRGD